MIILVTLLGNPHHFGVLNNPTSMLGACCHYDKIPTTTILCSATPSITAMVSNMVKIVKMVKMVKIVKL